MAENKLGITTRVVFWNVVCLATPYLFVQYFFFDGVLFRDEEAATASPYAKRLFALTVAVCVHSHCLLLADVLEMFGDGVGLSEHILTADVVVLLSLLVFVFPLTIF